MSWRETQTDTKTDRDEILLPFAGKFKTMNPISVGHAYGACKLVFGNEEDTDFFTPLKCQLIHSHNGQDDGGGKGGGARER